MTPRPLALRKLCRLLMKIMYRMQEKTSPCPMPDTVGMGSLGAARLNAGSDLDLIVIYLPLVGAERQMDVATVGLIMAVRAASSMTARLVYVPLVDLMGRGPLTYLAMLCPAAAFIVVASPAPLWALYPAMVVAGLVHSFGHGRIGD